MNFGSFIYTALAAVLFVFPSTGSGAEKGPIPAKADLAKSRSRTPTMAILDLVDLTNEKPLPNFTNTMRHELALLKRWDVLSRDNINNRLSEYKKSLNITCNNSQCSFEYGSLIQADYVLFGSATRFKGMGMVTLKLLSISKAKIVWSNVLSARNNKNDMAEAFSKIRETLSSAQLNESSGEDKTLAIMSFSDESLEAKILFERILTHAYRNGKYEIMSPVEVQELLAILEIEPTSLMSSVNEMDDIGRKLGVNAVIFTQLIKKGVNYKHSILIYDVDEKSVLLSMPPLPNSNFQQMLTMEKNFFFGLEGLLNRPPAPIRK